MSIGQNIKARRLELRLTLEEVAQGLGVSRQTMSRYETGVIGNIPQEKVEGLARILQVTPAQLMGWDEGSGLSHRDERDIEKKLADVLSDLEAGQEGLMFSGKALDEDTRRLLADSLRSSMQMGKALAKQKYTPKKYRKED